MDNHFFSFSGTFGIYVMQYSKDLKIYNKAWTIYQKTYHMDLVNRLQIAKSFFFK